MCQKRSTYVSNETCCKSNRDRKRACAFDQPRIAQGPLPRTPWAGPFAAVLRPHSGRAAAARRAAQRSLLLSECKHTHSPGSPTFFFVFFRVTKKFVTQVTKKFVTQVTKKFVTHVTKKFVTHVTKKFVTCHEKIRDTCHEKIRDLQLFSRECSCS